MFLIVENFNTLQKIWELGKLNHVAIAVPDLEAASKMYRNVLGANVSEAVVIVKNTFLYDRFKTYVNIIEI